MNQQYFSKGRRFDKNPLFIENDAFEPSLVLDVLSGVQAGIIFRNYLSKNECSTITKNFWDHPNIYKRDKDVPAFYVGTFHYNKLLENYLEEAYLSNSYIDNLFDGIDGNPINQLISDLNIALSKTGRRIRIAMHSGRLASRFVMRSWAGTNEYSLLPHEDQAQCFNPIQIGFEIQQTTLNSLVAVNLCVESTGGGILRYWNIIPDKDFRDELGLSFAGIPYPLEYLADIDYQDIPINPGDLYFFNGSAVHAVTSISGIQPQRATISFFMGQLNNDKELIYWA